MSRRWKVRIGRARWSIGLFFLLALFILAGCGGSNAGTASYSQASNGQTHSMAAIPANNSVNSGANQSANTKAQQGPASGPQYLVKTLNVALNVKDTRQVASALQGWITTTDPRATSEGTDYEQVGNSLYNVTLTFSVEATLYPQIYQYMRDYTMHNGGQLAGFHETVQDVTGDYVDTQSRISNLKAEQDRLQTLMSNAQSMSDIITIEQKLSDVEGTIESDEAHMNMLTSQVAFYTVTINLQPIQTAPPPTNTGGWSFAQVLHDAFTASVGFAQSMVTFLVWLLAFCVYLIPIGIIFWLVRRWRGRFSQMMPRPKVAPALATAEHEETMPEEHA